MLVSVAYSGEPVVMGIPPHPSTHEVVVSVAVVVKVSVTCEVEVIDPLVIVVGVTGQVVVV